MKKINYKPIVKKAIYYSVTILFLIGIIGGIKAYFIRPTVELADADSYTLQYVTMLFNKPTEEIARTERKNYLVDNLYNSTEYYDIFDSDITIAVTTEITKKKEQTIIDNTSFMEKEYVYAIDYAYRYNDSVETQQQQEVFKIILLYDKRTESYIIQSYTAYDYAYAVGVSNEAKKAFDEMQKQKTNLRGDSLSEAEKESYYQQLLLFFDAYSADINAAKSLVSASINLPVLSGKFDTETMKITHTAKERTKENVYLLIQIDYANADQSLKYKKKFRIMIVDKTIVELEEI